VLGGLVAEIEKALGCRVFPAVIKDRRGPQGLNFELPALAAFIGEEHCGGRVLRRWRTRRQYCAKVAVRGRTLLHGRWDRFGSWARQQLAFM